MGSAISAVVFGKPTKVFKSLVGLALLSCCMELGFWGCCVQKGNLCTWSCWGTGQFLSGGHLPVLVQLHAWTVTPAEKQHVFFFFKGFICISDFKKPQLHSELSASDVPQCRARVAEWLLREQGGLVHQSSCRPVQSLSVSTRGVEQDSGKTASCPCSCQHHRHG